jgi:hypothetical protein
MPAGRQPTRGRTARSTLMCSAIGSHASDGQQPPATIPRAHLPRFDVIDRNRGSGSADGLPSQRQNAPEHGRPERCAQKGPMTRSRRLKRPTRSRPSDAPPMRAHRVTSIHQATRCASRSAVKRLTSTPSNSSPWRRRTPQATTICAKPAPCSTQPRLGARRRPVQFPEQELDDRANEFSYGDPEEGKVKLLNTLDAKVRIGRIGHPPERSSAMLSKTNRTMTAAGQSLGLAGRHHRCCDVGVPQTLFLTARGL